MADESEKSPLLYPEVSEVPSAPAYPEAPPPYCVVPADDSASLCCGVCGAQMALNLTGNQHIVRCGVCNEATPLRSPPEGKRFVRCPCHCLLICNMSSQRVACPRPQCKRVLELTGSDLNSVAVQTYGTRAVCGHCSQTFLVLQSERNQRVRCPHCRKVSFIGQEIRVKRCVSSSLLAVFFAIVSGALIAVTVDEARDRNVIYAAWTFLLMLCVGCVYLAVYWARIKVSTPL